MKLRLLILETRAPAWVEAGREEYVAKLKPLVPFEILRLKSPSADRDSASVKMKKEAEIILDQIDEDFLVLFDEAGKSFLSSEDFSKHFMRVLESGKTRITFCIGGPYGYDESVKSRSQARWSLSGLTFNHWIAQLVALEQMYRAMTIIKGIPYHNR